MLKVTIVRHGESVDNLRPIWAGHLDAPLSNHGQNQAKLVGKHFSQTKIDAIYASDLKRAHWTALNIHNANRIGIPDEEVAQRDSVFSLSEENGNGPSQAPPDRPYSTNTHRKPPTSKLLREQNFGDAEGQSWDSGKYATSESNWMKDREFRYPNGESLNDVHARAQKVVAAVVKPWLLLSLEKDHHIFLVAHGIANAELVSAICQLDADNTNDYLGSMPNTAFHTLGLKIKPGAPKLSQELIQQVAKALDTDEFPQPVPAVSSLDIPIQVDVLERCSSGHTRNLKRQAASRPPVTKQETASDPRSG